MADRLVVLLLAAMVWVDLLHQTTVIVITDGPGFRFKLGMLALATVLGFLLLASAFAGVSWREIFGGG